MTDKELLELEGVTEETLKNFEGNKENKDE